LSQETVPLHEDENCFNKTKCLFTLIPYEEDVDKKKERITSPQFGVWRFEDRAGILRVAGQFSGSREVSV
jgi:hypothetical protein